MPEAALALAAPGDALTAPPGFWRSLVSKFPWRIERRNSNFSSIAYPNEQLLQALGIPTKSGAPVTPDTALTVTTVNACVRLISGITSRLPIRLLQDTGKGTKIITDHPALSLVRCTPDGFRPAFKWRRMMELTALLRGNSPSRIVRNSYFEPIALKWMNPIQFECWRTPEGDPFYRYRGEILLPQDVFVHADMSMDGIVGMSPITVMRESIGLAITTQEYAARYFANGASPGVVLVAPLSATKQQMDQIRAEVEKNHGGVANTNKPFVAYGGLTVSTIPLNNADSQFLESREFDVEEICRAYGVPPHLVGATAKVTSWGTGIEQMNRGFLDYSIGDRIKNWEGEYDMNLLTKAERDSGFHFKFDTSLLTKGSALERAQTHLIYRNIGVESVNDVRESEGMNDIDAEIGEDYQLPFNATGGAAQNSEQAPNQEAQPGKQPAQEGEQQ